MKNKKEQIFCTKLGAWLKNTNHTQSMLIECKVSENTFLKFDAIRKSQQATLRRLQFGLPIVHKISDSSVGSKLVDMIYISHKNTKLKPFVSVYFTLSKSAYLVPWSFIEANSETTRIWEDNLLRYKIW